VAVKAVSHGSAANGKMLSSNKTLSDWLIENYSCEANSCTRVIGVASIIWLRPTLRVVLNSIAFLSSSTYNVWRIGSLPIIELLAPMTPTGLDGHWDAKEICIRDGFSSFNYQYLL
jgi:hypothetical protein